SGGACRGGCPGRLVPLLIAGRIYHRAHAGGQRRLARVGSCRGISPRKEHLHGAPVTIDDGSAVSLRESGERLMSAIDLETNVEDASRAESIQGPLPLLAWDASVAAAPLGFGWDAEPLVL